MNAKKLLALILALMMVISMAACATTEQEETTEQTVTEESTEKQEDPTPEVTPASVDFEDGNMGFVALYEGMANSDASTIEVVDYNGSKALKVTNGSGKVPYVAFDVWSLLGENAANVASIEMTMGIENPGDKFYACSGKVFLWNTKELSKSSYGWSVYMENKNPKTSVVTLADQAFSADVAPIMVVSLDTDNGAATVGNANFYIDDIRFLDASGNLLSADTSAAFAAPSGFSGEKDMSNLKYLKANTVSLEGMSGISGTAWGQDGVEMTEEFLAALVPGAIIEIEFSSTSGDMWIVLPDATPGGVAAWSRVEQQTAPINNSKNICQISYEQIAAVCGENVEEWGARLQCESSGDWEVYSVKVGQDSGLVTSAAKTAWYEGSITGSAWGQDGIDLTEDMIASLVPGTMIEVKYTTTSATGDLWIVMPDAAPGGVSAWTRVEQQTASCDGSTMQISYEQLAAACGDNVADWGTRLQLESDGDWEVYSVSLVTSYFASLSNTTEIEGFACTGDGWAQNGFELTAEQWALMAPGSIIEVKYTSENDDLWAVIPWATAGWMRINADNGITPIADGSTLQVTYEQIASVCGENVADWGTMLQFEASGSWEVYTVTIGTQG